MQCTICCDAFNLSSKKKTECPYCKIEVCMTCNKKYLIESIQDPHCMNCMKVWPLEIFKNMVPYAFIIKDYKNHRENVLFEREVARLPETLLTILSRSEIWKKQRVKFIKKLPKCIWK